MHCHSIQSISLNKHFYKDFMMSQVHTTQPFLVGPSAVAFPPSAPGTCSSERLLPAMSLGAKCHIWGAWKINIEPKSGGLEDDFPFQLDDS